MRYGMTTGLMLSGAFVWFSCMDIVITGEKYNISLEKCRKQALFFNDSEIPSHVYAKIRKNENDQRH